MESFSTDAIEPAKRLGFWRDIISQFFGELDYSADSPEQFRGELKAASAGQIKAARFYTTPHSLHNPSQPFSSVYVVGSVEGELSVTQNGKSHIVKPRDFVIFDSQQEVELEMINFTDGYALNIPLSVAPGELTRALSYSGMPIDGSKGIGAVATDFIRTLSLNSSELSADQAYRLMPFLIDLLNSAVLANVGKTYWPTSRNRAFQLQKIRLVIDGKLREPELSPETIAKQHGISRRYLNKLFEDEGISVMRFILRRRLQHCMRDLACLSQRDKSITEIAYSWGFNDISHFNRAFKDRFGMTPGQARPKANTKKTIN